MSERWVTSVATSYTILPYGPPPEQWEIINHDRKLQAEL
jgi:hypothetical protein